MELEARGDDWERLSAELEHWRQRGLASSNAGFLRAHQLDMTFGEDFFRVEIQTDPME